MTISCRLLFPFSGITSDFEIMVMRDDDKSWSVYYKKPYYPFISAFGLPDYENLETVKEIAINNAPFYDCLFT